MLAKAWTIINKWVNGDGIITTVEFSLRFTDDAMPGVHSDHGGSVAITQAALPSSASGSDLVAAMMAVLGDTLEHLEQGHGRQLEYLFGMANATKVPVAEQPLIFPTLTPRQLWLAARQISITKDQVLAIIDAMPETTPEEIDDKQVARIEIMEAPSYKRDHPLVAMLSGLVGLTATELDDLWVWAAGL